MNERDLCRLSEYFDERIDLSDFTTEELEEMLQGLPSDEKFKDNYFAYYDDVKDKSRPKQDW